MLPITNLQNPLTRKCFALLMKVLYVVQDSGFPLQKYVKEYDSKKEKMIERVLSVLDAFAQNSILSEAEKIIFKSPKKSKAETAAKAPQSKKQQEVKVRRLSMDLHL
jgi:hypothetical protein